MQKNIIPNLIFKLLQKLRKKCHIKTPNLYTKLNKSDCFFFGFIFKINCKNFKIVNYISINKDFYKELNDIKYCI